ncbi:MAG TPA: hypothetical protein VNS55_01070 [Nocardioides sp.]|nr:hypothetical protein [Nocardioides sp.]
MKNFSLRGLPALLVLAVTLVLGATSGAVAGGLITSAQIKDGNVRSVDIKDGTVGLADLSQNIRTGLLHGFEVRVASSGAIDPGGTTSVRADCPDGKVALGGSVDWGTEDADVTTSYRGSTYFVGRGRNTVGGADTLVVVVTCATME